MKRKIFIAIMALIAAISCAFGLAGCNPGGSEGGSESDGNGEVGKPDNTEGKDDKNDINEEKPMPGLLFTLNDDGNTYTVKGTTQMFEEETIVIPETYKGKKVTVVGDSGFHNCTKVSTVTLPNCITLIDNCAFSNCRELKTINIPDSVIKLGPAVFQKCTKLASITLPESLKEIGQLAFDECDSLTSIEIPDSVELIGFDAFKSSGVQHNIYDKGMYVGNTNNPFRFLVQVFGTADSCIVHNDTEYICTSAFYDCRGIFKVTIPKGIKSINSWAFCLCPELFLIEFGGSLSEWEKVDKGYEWYGFVKNCVVQCTDGNTNVVTQ